MSAVRAALLFLFPSSILLSNVVKIPLGGDSALSLSFPMTALSLFVLYLMSMAGERPPRIYLPGAAFLLAFLGVAIFSALRSSSSAALSLGNAGAVPYLVFSVLCLVGFLNMITDRRDLLISVSGIVFAGLIQVGAGAWAVLTEGVTGNQLGTATLIDNKPAFAQFMLPVSLLFLMKARLTGLSRPFWGCMFLAGSLLFFVVIARSALLGLVGALVLVYGRTRMFWLVASVGIGGLALTVALKPDLFSETLYYSLRSFDINFVLANPDIPEVTSFYLRAALFVIGFQMLLQNPVLGIGPGAFAERMAGIPIPAFVNPADHLVSAPESGYFLVLVETGLLGFLLYATFFSMLGKHLLVTTLRARDRVNRAVLEALTLAILSLFLMNFAQETFTTTFTWYLLGLTLAATRVLRPEQPSLPLPH